MKSLIIIAVLIAATLLVSCNGSTLYKTVPLKDTTAIVKTLDEALKEDSKTHAITMMLPDAQSAVKVAEIYMINVYGKDQILNERPYLVSKYKNYWLVNGSLPDGYNGGVFSVILDSRNGQVMAYSHGK